MRAIEQLVHHFWARGALTREEALYLVGHGFARACDLPGLTDNPPVPEPEAEAPPATEPDYDRELEELRAKEAADTEARRAEELEDELVGRNASSKKGGGKKKKPTGHDLEPLITNLSVMHGTREQYPALLELGTRLKSCADWRAAARAVGSARPEALENALVGLLNTRARALGELWFWFDLEPLYEWADHRDNAGPVAEALSKLLRADNPDHVGRLGQLRKAAEVQSLLDLLTARRAFLNLLPVLYHAHFPKLGQWLVPPAGVAGQSWPALPWSFVILYNARHGSPTQPPHGYPVDARKLPFRVVRNALALAFPMAPVAIREMLIERLRDRPIPVLDEAHWEKYLVFDRDLYCPFTWRM